MVNCVLAGSCMPTRIRPLCRSREKSNECPGATVGQTAPSTVENKGSWPPVASNICSARAALKLMPFSGRWQVAQARPLVPRDWKNGPDSLKVPLPLLVSTKPLWSWNGNRLGRDAATTAAAASAATAHVTIVFRALDARILTRMLGISVPPHPVRHDTPHSLDDVLIKQRRVEVNR